MIQNNKFRFVRRTTTSPKNVFKEVIPLTILTSSSEENRFQNTACVSNWKRGRSGSHESIKTCKADRHNSTFFCLLFVLLPLNCFPSVTVSCEITSKTRQSAVRSTRYLSIKLIHTPVHGLKFTLSASTERVSNYWHMNSFLCHACRYPLIQILRIKYITIFCPNYHS